jgi:hypothetical protein
VNIKKSIDSLSEENDKLNAYINKADKKIKEYQSKEEEIRNLNYKKGILESTINSLNNSINNLVESKDSKAEEENANNIEREIESKNDIRKSLLKRKNLLETSVLFLKDTGIKAKVISQYIDIINETINNYMHKLNLFVRFELNENFEESIKSRHIDSFEYQSFSSGERHKIDLSILFMFIDIASRKNNVQTNLLLLDEILDSSLDTEAKQLALKLIKNSKDKNTIIITHSDEIIESLNGSSDILIRAEKKGNFSYYTKIN